MFAVGPMLTKTMLVFFMMKKFRIFLPIIVEVCASISASAVIIAELGKEEEDRSSTSSSSFTTQQHQQHQQQQKEAVVLSVEDKDNIKNFISRDEEVSTVEKDDEQRWQEEEEQVHEDQDEEEQAEDQEDEEEQAEDQEEEEEEEEEEISGRALKRARTSISSASSPPSLEAQQEAEREKIASSSSPDITPPIALIEPGREQGVQDRRRKNLLREAVQKLTAGASSFLSRRTGKMSKEDTTKDTTMLTRTRRQMKEKKQRHGLLGGGNRFARTIAGVAVSASLIGIFMLHPELSAELSAPARRWSAGHAETFLDTLNDLELQALNAWDRSPLGTRFIFYASTSTARSSLIMRFIINCRLLYDVV